MWPVRKSTHFFLLLFSMVCISSWRLPFPMDVHPHTEHSRRIIKCRKLFYITKQCNSAVTLICKGRVVEHSQIKSLTDKTPSVLDITHFNHLLHLNVRDVSQPYRVHGVAAIESDFSRVEHAPRDTLLIRSLSSKVSLQTSVNPFLPPSTWPPALQSCQCPHSLPLCCNFWGPASTADHQREYGGKGGWILILGKK